jgi:hypothetical protein
MPGEHVSVRGSRDPVGVGVRQKFLELAGQRCGEQAVRREPGCVAPARQPPRPARSRQRSASGGRSTDAGSGTETERSSAFRSPVLGIRSGSRPVTAVTFRAGRLPKRTVPCTRTGTRATRWISRTGPTAFTTAAGVGLPAPSAARAASRTRAMSTAATFASTVVTGAEVVLMSRTPDASTAMRSGRLDAADRALRGRRGRERPPRRRSRRWLPCRSSSLARSPAPRARRPSCGRQPPQACSLDRLPHSERPHCEQNDRDEQGNQLPVACQPREVA